MVSRKTTWVLKLVLPAGNLTLNSDTVPGLQIYVRSTQGSSTLSMKRHSETHIITNTMVKPSKGLNDDLKPEHKKNTNRTTVSQDKPC